MRAPPIITFCRWVFGLCLVVAGATSLPSVAQGVCEPGLPIHEPPDYIVSYPWDQVYQSGAGPQQIAVIVWDGDQLYEQIGDRIRTYADDVAAEGYDVTVFTFIGLAADPRNPGAPDLRTQLRQLYDSSGGALSGAVLVGDIPTIIYEEWECLPGYECNFTNFACDVLLGDLHAEIADLCDEEEHSACDDKVTWRADVFDHWSSGQMDIWTSRIQARPELVSYLDGLTSPPGAWTEADVLGAYFDRNHATRWNAFSGNSLYYSQFDYSAWGVEQQILAALRGLFAGADSFIGMDRVWVEGPCGYAERLANPFYSHIEEQSHGCGTGHWLGMEVCTPEQYVAAGPQAYTLTCVTCELFDFAIPQVKVGEAAVFSPEPQARTLAALGATNEPWPLLPTYVIYNTIGSGGCLGDALKAMYNGASDRLGFACLVILGDGTLKRWTHPVVWQPYPGGGGLWGDRLNWPDQTLPGSGDKVQHDLDDTIQMDVTDQVEIAAYQGTGSGALAVLPQRNMLIDTNCTLSTEYVLVLQPGDWDPGTDPTALTVRGYLSGGNWTLNSQTQLAVGNTADSWCPTRSILRGGWTVRGPNTLAHFQWAESDEAAALCLALSYGAVFQLDEVPSNTKLFGSGQMHSLTYGPAYVPPGPHPPLIPNRLIAGSGGAGEALYLGDSTVLQRGVGDNLCLSLELSCSLSIASDFGHPEVAGSWDSTAVDVTLDPVTAGDSQQLELISPDLLTSWTVKPVIFLDVPQGAFRDLVLTDVEQVGDAVPIDVVRGTDNWPDGSSRESGFFRNVTLGQNRTMYFHWAQGLIYFYGNMTCPQSTRLFLDGVGIDTYTPVFKQAVASDYGDFDGNCVLSNKEMSDLQQAISRHQYRAFYDSNADGVLDNADMAKFMYNYAHQPPPDCAGGQRMLAGEGAADDCAFLPGAPEDLGDGGDPSEAVDLCALSEWLISSFGAEDLAAFVAQASATAAAHAEEPVAAEMLDLLSYLPSP